MAGVGHEEQFLTSRLSAGCGFGKETFAGGATMRRKRRLQTFPPLPRNGEVRPKAVLGISSRPGSSLRLNRPRPGWRRK